MKFDMKIEQNFASFFNSSNGVCVFVDSFDNQEFDVRMGTLKNSVHVGTVHATSDDELNEGLEKIAAESLILPLSQETMQ